MLDAPWQLLLVALGIANVVVALLVLSGLWDRSSGQTEPTAPAESPPPARSLDSETETVTCPECGAVNERGYRFCRHCVTELPRQVDFERESGPPLVRGTR